MIFLLNKYCDITLLQDSGNTKESSNIRKINSVHFLYTKNKCVTNFKQYDSYRVKISSDSGSSTFT